MNQDPLFRPWQHKTLRLANEEFDLVAVGRALLQDPAWAAKIREGRTGELQAVFKQAFATLS
jgi:2,4-dienoyl-CoA reductase-like NADH-dependent reductase (Old Yellow Enzyme family)